LKEATENIRDAIQGVLLVMEQRGEPYKPTDNSTFIGEIAV